MPRDTTPTLNCPSRPLVRPWGPNLLSGRPRLASAPPSQHALQICLLRASRLARIGVSPMLDDMLNRTWDFRAGTMEANNVSGPMVITRTAAKLDVYVCGFMCTPFSSNGKREAGRAWVQERAPKTQTLAATRERACRRHRSASDSSNCSSQINPHLHGPPPGMGRRGRGDILGSHQDHCHIAAPMLRTGKRELDFQP